MDKANDNILYDEKKKIVMFYEGQIDDKVLSYELKNKLSSYMVPDILIKKQSLPQTGNGKIDRVSLKKEYTC